MRRSAGERRSASARPARRGDVSRADGRTFEIPDCGPVILTRGELARRTRERSRLAALKIAEAQAKEKAQVEEAAARKSAAKALAAQARCNNAARFCRDPSPSIAPGGGLPTGSRSCSTGTRLGNRRMRSTSPGSVPLSTSRRGHGAPSRSVPGKAIGDGGRDGGVVQSRGSRTGSQSVSAQQRRQTRQQRNEDATECKGGGGRRKSGGTGDVSGSSVSLPPPPQPPPPPPPPPSRNYRHHLSQPRLASTSEAAEPPLAPLRRRRAAGSSGALPQAAGAGRSAAEPPDLAGAEGVPRRRFGTTGDATGAKDRGGGGDRGGNWTGGVGGRGDFRKSEDGVVGGEVVRDRKAARTEIDGAVGSATETAAAVSKTRPTFTATRGRASTRGRGSSTRNSFMCTSRESPLEARLRQEEAARQILWQADKKEQRLRAKDEAAHRETLAFMAKQKKQAIMAKRKEEQEKMRQAEKLRRALQKLEEDRRHSLSQRPLRSRSKENQYASSSGRRPRSNTEPPARSRLIAGSSARRRPTVSSDLQPPGEARPAWVNVADGTPAPRSPPSFSRAGGPRRGLGGSRVARRTVEAAEAGLGRGGSLLRTATSAGPAPRTSASGGIEGRRRHETSAPQTGAAAAPNNNRRAAPQPPKTAPPPRSLPRSSASNSSSNPKGRSQSEVTRAPQRGRSHRAGTTANGNRNGMSANNAINHPAPYDAVGRTRVVRPGANGSHATAARRRGPGQSEVMRRNGNRGDGTVAPRSSRVDERADIVSEQGFESGCGEPEEGEWVVVEEKKEEEDVVDGGEGDGGDVGGEGDDELGDRFPDMLASLERVALTVGDLQGRCARLSHVIDGPSGPPQGLPADETRVPPAPAEEVAQAPTRPRVAGQVRPPVAAEARGLPPPPQQPSAQPPAQQQQQRREEDAWRAAIAVPSPVPLPRRQPSPILRPSSPDEHAPPLFASPLASRGVSPDGTGAFVRVGAAAAAAAGSLRPGSAVVTGGAVELAKEAGLRRRIGSMSGVEGAAGALPPTTHSSVAARIVRLAEEGDLGTAEAEEEGKKEEDEEKEEGEEQEEKETSGGVAATRTGAMSPLPLALATGLSSPCAVEEAWASPLDKLRLGSAAKWSWRGDDDGAGHGVDAATASGRASRLSGTARAAVQSSGIDETLKKLREDSLLLSVSAAAFSSGGGEEVFRGQQDEEDAKNQSRAEDGDRGAIDGRKESGEKGRRPELAMDRSSKPAVAASFGADGLPELMPRARRGRQLSSSEEFGDESDGDERGGGLGGRGANAAGGFSLVSMVAGEIMRSQREADETAKTRVAAVQETLKARKAAVAPGDEEEDGRPSEPTATIVGSVAVGEVLETRGTDIVLETKNLAASAQSGGQQEEKGADRESAAVTGVDLAAEPSRQPSRLAPPLGDEDLADGSGSSPAGHLGGDGGGNHPNLWDSLLESGPALSPARRRRLQGSRAPGSPPSEAVTNPPAGECVSGESGDGIGIGSGGMPAAGSRSRFYRRNGNEDGGEDGGGAVSREGSENRTATAAGAVRAQRGVSYAAGGEDAGVGPSRRLAPADLQAQLLNELRLHDDLQDVELQADGLMAAQKVEETRLEAQVAQFHFLLNREMDTKAQADALLQQQRVLEDALVRNDAAHEARLRRVKAEADNQAVRRAEAATVSVAAAAAASMGAQSRQASAAVAAAVAAGAHAQNQQAAAMAAQAAMFLEFKAERGRMSRRREVDGGNDYSSGDDGFDRNASGANVGGEQVEDDQGWPTSDRLRDNKNKGSSSPRIDFDSLLEHSPLLNKRNIIHTTPPRIEQGFWHASPPLSPENKDHRKPARVSMAEEHRREGRRQRQLRRHSGPIVSGHRGGGGGGGGRVFERGREGDGWEVSPERMRHSYDDGNDIPGTRQRRRRRSQSLGPRQGVARGLLRDGGGGDLRSHELDALADYRMAAFRDSCNRRQRSLEPTRRSGGPVGGAGRSQQETGAIGGSGAGAASVEYEAVRREIEREREAMSRRTQQQLRQLEGDDSSGSGGGGNGGGRSEYEDCSEERYTSFESGEEEDGEELGTPDLLRQRYQAARAAADSDCAQTLHLPEKISRSPQDGGEVEEYLGEDSGAVDEDEGEESLYLAESLAQELQESVVPLAAAGRPAAKDPMFDDRVGAMAASIRSEIEDNSSAGSVVDEMAVGGSTYEEAASVEGDAASVAEDDAASTAEHDVASVVPDDVASVAKDDVASVAEDDVASVVEDDVVVVDDEVAFVVEDDVASVEDDAASVVEDDAASVVMDDVVPVEDDAGGATEVRGEGTLERDGGGLCNDFQGKDIAEGMPSSVYSSKILENEEEEEDEDRVSASEVGDEGGGEGYDSASFEVEDPDETASSQTPVGAAATTAVPSQQQPQPRLNIPATSRSDPSEVEESGVYTPAGVSQEEATASGPTAAEYSQDFDEASSLEHTVSAGGKAPSPSLLTASAGLQSPAATASSPASPMVGDCAGEAANGGLRSASTGSLASMEAAVAGRKEKVQEMREQLEEIRSSRARVRAKRALAEKLGMLESEEAKLLEQLPAEELALARDQMELRCVMSREADSVAEPQRAQSNVLLAAAATATTAAVAAGEKPGEPEPPWGPEKLWSDSESEKGEGAEAVEQLWSESERDVGEEAKVIEQLWSESARDVGKAAEDIEQLWSDSESDVGEDAKVVEPEVGDDDTSGPAASAAAAADEVATESGGPLPESGLLERPEYSDIEPAKPPALADWIALGASEARQPLVDAASGSAREEDPKTQPDRAEEGDAYGPRDEEGVATRDVDDDSFGSGGRGGGGVDDDANISDADSEARLTALVAKVAVRGRESRAAQVVQALVRGRAARRFAVAQRGVRACAEVEAAARAAALAGEDGVVVQEEEGVIVGGKGESAAIGDMVWLAREERQGDLSDSFGSSDVEEDPAELERTAREIAAHEQEHSWLSRIAADKEETALTARLAAMAQEEVDRPAPAAAAAASALPQEREQRAIAPTDDDEADQESVGDDDDPADSVLEEDIPEEVDTVEEVIEESEDATVVAPAMLPGANAGSAVVEVASSPSLAGVHGLEATQVVGRGASGDIAAGVAGRATEEEEEALLNGDAQAPEAAVVVPAAALESNTEQGGTKQALGGVSTAFPREPSDGKEGAAAAGVGEGSEVGIDDVLAWIDNYQHVEPALPPENGTARLDPDDDEYGSGAWDGDSFDSVEAAVAPEVARETGDGAEEASPTHGSRARLPSPASADEDGDSAAEVDSDIEDEDDNAASIPKLGSGVMGASEESPDYGEDSFAGSEEDVVSLSSGVVGPAGVVDGEQVRSPVREGGTPTANGASDGVVPADEGCGVALSRGEVDDDDAYYSDLFEESDAEEEKEEEEEADGGDAGGDRGDVRLGAVEAGVGSADRGGDGEREVSSVSEVHSDVEDATPLAAAATAASGSFSVGRDYVEDALPAGSSPAMVDGYTPTDGNHAVAEVDSSVDSSSWQLLVFDASPSTVKGGGEEGEEQSPATALGSPGGVGFYESRGSRADLADDVSGRAGKDGTGLGQEQDGGGLLERFECVARSEESSSGRATGDSSVGLVLPSPGGTVGGDRTGSFPFDQDYVEDAEGVSPPPADGKVQMDDGLAGLNYLRPPPKEEGGDGDKSALLSAPMASSPAREVAGAADDEAYVAQKPATEGKVLKESLDEGYSYIEDAEDVEDALEVDEVLEGGVVEEDAAVVPQENEPPSASTADVSQERFSEGGGEVVREESGRDVRDDGAGHDSGEAREGVLETLKSGVEGLEASLQREERRDVSEGWFEDCDHVEAATQVSSEDGLKDDDAQLAPEREVVVDRGETRHRSDGHQDEDVELRQSSEDCVGAEAIHAIDSGDELEGSSHASDDNAIRPIRDGEDALETFSHVEKAEVPPAVPRRLSPDLATLGRMDSAAHGGFDSPPRHSRAGICDEGLETQAVEDAAVSTGAKAPPAVPRHLSPDVSAPGRMDSAAHGDFESPPRHGRAGLSDEGQETQAVEDAAVSAGAEAPPAVPRRLSPDVSALGRMDSAAHGGFDSPPRHGRAGISDKGQETQAVEDAAVSTGAAVMESYERTGYVEDAEPPAGVLPVVETVDDLAEVAAAPEPDSGVANVGVAASATLSAAVREDTSADVYAKRVEVCWARGAKPDAGRRREVAGDQVTPAEAVAAAKESGVASSADSDRDGATPATRSAAAVATAAAATAKRLADKERLVDSITDELMMSLLKSALKGPLHPTPPATGIDSSASVPANDEQQGGRWPLKPAAAAGAVAVGAASDEQQGRQPHEPATAAAAAAAGTAAAGDIPSGGETVCRVPQSRLADAVKRANVFEAARDGEAELPGDGKAGRKWEQLTSDKPTDAGDTPSGEQTVSRIPRNRLADAVKRVNVFEAARDAEAELRGDGKAGRKWEQLTSDEDAEEEEDGEGEDWGNAAVTETYRNEGGGMSSPELEERSGGTPEMRFLGERGAAGEEGGRQQEEEKEEEDEYYFPPLPLSRHKKPWSALAAAATDPGQDATDDPYASGQVSFGVRSGGGGGGGLEDGLVGETQDLAERQDVEEVAGGVELGEQEEEDGMMEENEWPEWPWWPVVADAIETSLRSMTLDELNERMMIHYLPDEPFIEELEGEDGLEFPPPQEAPLEDEAVIPPRVIDDLLDAPDEVVMASVTQMEGLPLPDRDAIDSARWMAYDAANEYLAEKRSKRAPRRPGDPPALAGKVLHRMPGFRHFTSIDQAIVEVTEAVLGQDGACLPGREQNPDLVEMLPLDSKPEEWILHEDDAYFIKCRVAEDILEELVDDTLQECKRVYALRDKARARWRKLGLGPGRDLGAKAKK